MDPALLHSEKNLCWHETVEKVEANELRFLHPKFRVYFDLANSSEETPLRAVYTVTTNPPAYIVTHTPPAPRLSLVAGNGTDGITTCYSKKKNKSWIKRQRCRECIGCLQKYHCGNCTGCKDNLKFGGSGKRHQTCIYRECQKLKFTPKDPVVYAKAASSQLLRFRCGKCIGCLRTEDCGQCLTCLNKKKKRGKHDLTCIYRECQKLKFSPRCDDSLADPMEGSPFKKIRLDSEDTSDTTLGYSPDQLPPSTIKNEIISDSDDSGNSEAEEELQLARSFKAVPDLELGTGDSEAEPDAELSEDELMDVTDYLLTMESSTHIEIYHLALVLGLSQSRVKGMMESPTFLDDVITAWLRREDQVTRRGVPTWENLVKALRHPRLKQTEIADKIASDKNIHQ